VSFAAAVVTGGCSYRGEGKVGVNRDDMRETLAKRMYATALLVFAARLKTKSGNLAANCLQKF
jgi:ribosomal protein S24E